jgi:hypothetical protein
MQDFTLSIDDFTFNQIFSAVGYPVVDETTFEHLLTKEQIKDLVIKPALVEFCTFFPQKQQFNVTVTGTGSEQYYNTDISDYAFALFSYKFSPASTTISNGSLMSQGGFYANPFYSASQVISIGGGGTINRYGTPFPFGAEQNIYQQRFYQKSVETMNKVYYTKWDDVNKRVILKSSLAGSFEVTLALIQPNVEEIDYRRRSSFIRYCQGKLKLANILGLSQTDLPVQIESADLRDDGKDLIDKELEYWRQASAFPIMR